MSDEKSVQAHTPTASEAEPSICVRALVETDLPAADHVMRLAFGTFLGLAEPLAFMGDADYVHTRWRADPLAAFAALSGDEIVGSNFATNWGSVGFFGPLTIHPRLWEQGVGKLLVAAALDCFERWGTTQAGLYTFADSAKHVALYRRFGFWPRFLTAIMSKPLMAATPAVRYWLFSALERSEREAALVAGAELLDRIYAGLDVRREILSVAAQALGDSVLLWDDAGLLGLAVCHIGAGSEAGSGSCYIKFAAVRPAAGAARGFERLLQACEALAIKRGATRLIAGVNSARIEACQIMLEQGFRTARQGVAMHRDNHPGYNRAGVYLIDDWR
jgi:GNAT superfamily N-acetyltransferase